VERRRTTAAWEVLETPPRSRADAARRLAQFIHRFFERLLTQEESHRLCRLIAHEAAEPTEAMDYIVRDFIVPHQRLLLDTLRVLRPQDSEAELSWLAQSVLGQILHYPTYRPVLERLGVLQESEVTGIADHIARFCLLGAGCSPRLVASACNEPAAPVTGGAL
jgi:hypothetical protein